MKKQKPKQNKLLRYWGFPFAADSDPSQEKKKEKGISLLIALMAIALMMGLSAEFIVSSAVNVEMALAARDKIKAEYLAKSGLNLSLFIISMSWGVDLFRAQPGTPDAAKKDLSDDDTSLWASLNQMPPMGAGTVDLMLAVGGGKSEADASNEKDAFKLKGIFSEKIAEQMRLFEDQFTVKITDEASKININDCYTGRCEEVTSKLIALFSCPAEKAFLDSKNLTPEQMAFRIKDFITSAENTSPESGFGDKNDPYQKQTPAYKVKGLPFDTIDELKLVEGWDDDMQTVFAPYLTVYPFNYSTTPKSSINLNTVSQELVSCLVPEARASACAEKFAVAFYKLKSKQSTVVAKDVKDTLKDLACYTGSTEEGKPAVDTWFDVKTMVLRIEVSAQTGGQDRQLVAVVRKIMPQDKENNRDKQKTKRSYEILYWKLI
jgi:type II secretory pathway component PulK